MRPEGKEASCRFARRRARFGLIVLLAAPASTIACAGAALAVQNAADKSMVKSQEASSALLRGRYDLAVAAYDDALKDTSLPPARQAPLYTDRGVAKWRLKQMDEAIADFTKAVSLNPEYAPAYNNRGNVYLDLNRADEAYKDFDRAISIAPGFGAAYSNRANVNQKLKRFEAAEKDFRKAIELLPGSAVPLNGRGKIARRRGPVLYGASLPEPGDFAERAICGGLPEQVRRLCGLEAERRRGAGSGQGNRAIARHCEPVRRARPGLCAGQEMDARPLRIFRKPLSLRPTMWRR